MSSEQSIKAKVSARPFVSRRLAGEDEPVWYAPPLGATGSAICFFAAVIWLELSSAAMAAFARLTPSKASSTSAVIAEVGATRFGEGAQPFSVRQ